MKKQLLFILFLNSIVSFGQATLIKDINLGNDSSNPNYKIAFKNHVYFVANDGLTGNELWRTDGTEEGTILFKEFIAGEDSGFSIFKFYADANLLYFVAKEGTDNYLWKTDGTENGTEKIKQFSSVTDFHTVINNELIFSANNQLWKTDGTENGTIKIENFPVFGNRFVKSGNEMYFSGESSSSIGRELYKTDGTENGAILVKDIRSGSSDSFPNHFIELNGVVYFSANNGSSGTELWKTDGTEAGTEMVKDIVTGSSSGIGFNTTFVTFNNILFFNSGNSLWASDGSSTNTLEIKNNLGNIKTMIVLGAKILIIATDTSTQKQVIWVSDGTVNGTTSFETTYDEFAHNSSFARVGNELYFQGRNNFGYELWKTDGTENGTVLVKDIHPEFDDNNIEDIISFGNNILLTASDGNWKGKELYISDGTENGTKLLKDINKQGNRSSNAKNYFKFGDKILFSADDGEHGKELWVIENGIASLLKDINTGHYYSNPSKFIELNNTVYFIATTRQNGKELWKTDGTKSGTTLVKDIYPNEADGILEGNFVTLNNKIYFIGDDGSTGFELWESDGTQAGTKLVTDVNGTSTRSIFNPEIAVLKGDIFFIADDGTNGAELWKFDGSSVNLVKDINANGGANIRFLTVHPYLEKLYFSAYNGSETNLWESDGSSNTSKQSIKNPSNFKLSGSRDIGDRSSSNIIFNTELYFSGQSTSNFNNKGTELWAVTYIGTIQQVHDINPNSSHSYPQYLTDVNGKLYFIANDGTHGNELWRANGVANAEFVKDVNTGSSSSWITAIGGLGNTVLFGAGNSSSSKELWKSDGTTDGTSLFQEINPSTEQYNSGSNPKDFFSTNGVLYFSADNGINGSEIFSIEEAVLSVNNTILQDKTLVKMYPNPMVDQLNFYTNGEKIKSIRLFNILGKEVLNLSNKNNLQNINVSQLKSGLYIVELKTNNLSIKKKILKK